MINRPINIPGRRKVITKNMILEAQKYTKSRTFDWTHRHLKKDPSDERDV